MADELSKVFDTNEVMTELFVNPLGIDNALAHDMKYIETVSKEKGFYFKISDYGEAGNLVDIVSPNLKVNGVGIANVYIISGKDAGSIAYESEQTDNYRDMATYMEKHLSEYTKIAENVGGENAHFNLYMVGDRYAVGIGCIPERHTAIAYFMDINNIAGFMNLGTLLQTQGD